MSTIQGTNGTPATIGAMLGIEPQQAGLTPESLLLYCSSRIETLDTMIRGYFKDQEKNNKRLADAGRVIAQLGNFKAGMNGTEGINGSNEVKQAHVGMANEVQRLHNETDDPVLKAKLAEVYQTVTGRSLSDFKNPDGSFRPFKEHDFGEVKQLEPHQWDSFAAAVKEHQSSLSKGSEMNMIGLQSIVSQRQLAIQMTTQLLQMHAEGLKQICGNLRA